MLHSITSNLRVKRQATFGTPSSATCPGPLGAFKRALSVSHSKSFLYGGFVWARRALSSQKCIYGPGSDGSDQVITQDCAIKQNKDGSWGSGAAVCGAVHGTAYFSVDNGYDFYVNGDKIGSANDWTKIDRFTFEAACDVPTAVSFH